MDDIKIVHLKSNAQQLETWIAMVNGEIVGHIYMERERDQNIIKSSFERCYGTKKLEKVAKMVGCCMKISYNIKKRKL